MLIEHILAAATDETCPVQAHATLSSYKIAIKSIEVKDKLPRGFPPSDRRSALRQAAAGNRWSDRHEGP